MSWQPSHPGGIITCDAHGCTRTRRSYCAPTESDRWESFVVSGLVLDLCPRHRQPGDPS